VVRIVFSPRPGEGRATGAPATPEPTEAAEQLPEQLAEIRSSLAAPLMSISSGPYMNAADGEDGTQLDDTQLPS
jgi:hypothetical protein